MRAKITIQQVTKTAYGTEQVVAHGVCSNSPEDNSFTKATPVLKLEMSIDNPAAQGFLIPGKNYFLDFTAADIAIT